MIYAKYNRCTKVKRGFQAHNIDEANRLSYCEDNVSRITLNKWDTYAMSDQRDTTVVFVSIWTDNSDQKLWNHQNIKKDDDLSTLSCFREDSSELPGP